MKKIIILCFLCCFIFPAVAARVDTVAVPSKAMEKTVKTVIISPQNYESQGSYPVVYLLHGYGDNYRAWVEKAPEIKRLSDQYEMIIVCPDGETGSWYWDSLTGENMFYETFVSTELVEWVDAHYATLSQRSARAITGLSMGGHGALFLAIKHPEVFGAVGSTAGGVDIRPFPKNWDMEKRLGAYSRFPDRWREHTVMGLLHLIEPGSLQILIDCGTEDFFYGVNERLHEQLNYNSIAHTFISRPGAHNWDYWRASIPFQLLFMHNYFQAQRQSAARTN